MVVTLIQMSFFNPIEVELLDSGNVNFFREILAYSRNFSEYCIADRHSDDPVFPLVVKGQEEGKGDKSQFLPSWFCAGHPPLINDDIKMNKTIVGIGEALWDVFPGGKKLGGAPANFAFHVFQFVLATLAVSVAAILHGTSVTEAHRLAVDVSAYVCIQDGAMPLLPEELTERVKG
jgi:hypothetical protein